MDRAYRKLVHSNAILIIYGLTTLFSTMTFLIVAAFSSHSASLSFCKQVDQDTAFHFAFDIRIEQMICPSKWLYTANIYMETETS